MRTAPAAYASTQKNGPFKYSLKHKMHEEVVLYFSNGIKTKSRHSTKAQKISCIYTRDIAPSVYAT